MSVLSYPRHIRSMPFLQSSPHWRKNCRKRRRRDTTMQDFSWIASSGRSRRTFCSRQRGCSITWGKSFKAVRPRRKTAASRSTANALPSCVGCAWLPDTRRTITSRSRRTIPCRWAGNAVQNLRRHRQRKPK